MDETVSKLELLRKRVHLRNQLEICLKTLAGNDAWIQADSLTDNVKKMIRMAKELYPDEFDKFIFDIDDSLLIIDLSDYSWKDSQRKGMKRKEELRSCVQSMLGYVVTDLGDPYVRIVLTDSLNDARDAANRGHVICSIFLTRIALEQGLKSICRMRQVEYDEKDTAGRINTRLLEDDQSWKPHYLDINSKLERLNGPAHGTLNISEAETRALIEWTDRFLLAHLSGHIAR